MDIEFFRWWVKEDKLRVRRGWKILEFDFLKKVILGWESVGGLI